MIFVNWDRRLFIVIESKSKQEERIIPKIALSDTSTRFNRSVLDFLSELLVSIVIVGLAAVSFFMSIWTTYYSFLLLIPIGVYVLWFCLTNYNDAKLESRIKRAYRSHESHNLEMLYKELNDISCDKRVKYAPEPGSFFEEVCLLHISHTQAITDQRALRRLAGLAARKIEDHWESEKKAAEEHYEKLLNETTKESEDDRFDTDHKIERSS